MARQAELFVRELTDEEAAHLLKQARRGKNAVVRDRAMLLFATSRARASPRSRRCSGPARPTSPRSSTTSTRGGSRPGPSLGRGPTPPDRPVQRTEIVKAALARPTDRGEPFTSWSLTKLQDYVVRAGIVPAISRSQLCASSTRPGSGSPTTRPGRPRPIPSSRPRGTGSSTCTRSRPGTRGSCASTSSAP